MIIVLDNSFNRLGVIKNAIESTRLEEINGENILDFSAVLDEKLNDFIDEDTIFELDDDYFDTALFKKVANEDNTYTVDVESEHVSYRLNDPLFNVEFFTELGEPSYILGKILEGTGFTIGTIEFSGTTAYSAQEAKSRRQLLMEFVAYLGGEVIFHKFEVSIVQHRGSLESKPVIKDRNVKVVSKTLNKRQLDELGNFLVSYTCTPIFLGISYDLGDNVRLMQKELGINEELRVISISRNPYNEMEITFQFANYENSLASSLYRIEVSSVLKDKLYNGTRIGPEYGFEAVRNDKKARAYFRSDEMKFQSGDGSGTSWTDRLYYEYDSDADETTLVFNGKFTAESVEVLKILIADSFYANMGDVADLTVDELSTAKKLAAYLASDTSDINYIRIKDLTQEFITASTTGTDDEQAKNRSGQLLYWTDDTFEHVTTSSTEYPAMQYIYTELTKLKLFFEYNGTNYIPKIVFGAGTGEGDNGKAFMYKDEGGLYIDYNTNTGGQFSIWIDDDGIHFDGVPEIIYETITAIVGMVQVWVQDDTPLAAKVNDLHVDTDDYSRYDVQAVGEGKVLAASDDEVLNCNGTFTVTLHDATAEGIVKRIFNTGTGVITVAGTINGSAAGMYLFPGEGVELTTDGSGWRH